MASNYIVATIDAAVLLMGLGRRPARAGTTGTRPADPG